MKYLIDDTEQFETVEEVAQFIIDNLDDEVYDNMLDECYEEVTFGTLSYCPSIALYRLDPIAYNCGRSDYYDSLYSDIVYELERYGGGSFYGFDVEEVEDEEDEEED